jgi:hypothetical protein
MAFDEAKMGVWQPKAMHSGMFIGRCGTSTDRQTTRHHAASRKLVYERKAAEQTADTLSESHIWISLKLSLSWD